MNALRVGVIGLGRMGRHHARVLADLPGALLVGVADTDPRVRAEHRAAPLAHVYDDASALLEQAHLDAAVIAVPPERHREVACAAMERGVHVLVEKPLATSIADGEAIVHAARRAGVTLMVGHVERYNPALRELARRVRGDELGAVWKLDARRLLPSRARSAPTGVVLDLASHDIDAMLHVTRSRVVRAYAETSRSAPEGEDAVAGLLRFDSGAIGAIAASRRGSRSVRELTVTCEGGTLVLDYLAQELHLVAGGVARESISLSRRDPLRDELEAFLAAARDGLPSPVSGEEGLATVRVALALIAAGREGRTVTW
jgi:UDP-N-acetylglucosamine 3-dehydrogenase